MKLQAEFTRLKSRKDSRRIAELQRFQKKLGEMRFFDPACGCGNFLIIAYRELRLLEIEVLKEIHQAGQLDAMVHDLSQIDVDQFYGIELKEFPVRIAETALWMMDHIMNNRLSLEFGQIYARIPLQTAPHILHGDAVEIDWKELLPPEKCSFLFGNPPFGGFVMRNEQKQRQTKSIMTELGAMGSRLDYVAVWFLKAGDYLKGKRARIAFVATNSITQGEQVAQLWPALFDRYNLEIMFGHRTFPWGSDARGAARVHVVIIGLSDHNSPPLVRRLFTYENSTGEPDEIELPQISPYLVGASHLDDSHLVITRHRNSVSGLPKIGCSVPSLSMADITSWIKKKEGNFWHNEPGAASLLHPFIGGREYINGLERWILLPLGASPSELRAMPGVVNRVRAVREYKNESHRQAREFARRATHRVSRHCNS